MQFSTVYNCRIVVMYALYVFKDVVVHATAQNKRSCSTEKRCGS